jgi:hypothetical protein
LEAGAIKITGVQEYIDIRSKKEKIEEDYWK